MTMHRDKFLVNETNRCTEFQFYWYYDYVFRAATYFELFLQFNVLTHTGCIDNGQRSFKL